MPCCAFAACIVAQLLVALRAVKGTLFGTTGALAQRNLVVEWRLDPAAGPRFDSGASFSPWFFGRRSFRGLAFAAALETVILLGAVYGFLEHAGHGGAHSTHVHRAEPGQNGTRIHDGVLDSAASPSR